MTTKDRYRLAAETDVHPRTVQKWADGEKVASQTAYALVAAAKKLRIKLPGGTSDDDA